MRSYSYKIQLADALWAFRVPMELKPGDSCLPFMTDQDGCDICLDFREGLPEKADEVCIRHESPKIWRGTGYYRIERSLPMKKEPYSSVYLEEQNSHTIHGLIYPEGKKYISTVEMMLGLSELEVLLSGLDAVSLHSSLIRYHGNAVLFTAPSGVGKSTQAELWRKYRGAEILNGDRTILRKTDGEWNGFGSPFAGSSGIYKNESAPVRAIVILRQASSNSVAFISPSEAFRSLYSEIVMPLWNEEIHNHIMDLIAQIVEDIPIVMLHCLPNEDAVELLDQFLREEKR